MVEHHTLPNGLGVDFYPETHTYVVNGIELPSITTLLKEVYGDTYSAVKPELLKAASEYGTAVHNELQMVIEGFTSLDETQYPETKNFFSYIMPRYNIKPVMTEKVVVLYDPSGKPVAAGRFDLLCEVNGKLTLADFKTTSAIHRQLVTAQLNLYLIAAYQSGYLDNKDLDLGVVHLHGSTYEYKPMVKLNENFYLKFII